MENNTIKLLRECNAGIKMGESAISKVLPHAKDKELKKVLEVCKNTHSALGDETHALLNSMGADTKDAHPIARVMSDMKIYAKMINPTDADVANVMSDGCSMGIRSISKYLNEYSDASKDSRNIAERLVASEEFLEKKLRNYL